jgi:formate dehydrogenase major subunit
MKVILNNEDVEVSEQMTILELANREGIDIPTFCYIKELEPYTSCFLCVVEIEGMQRLPPSCGTMVQDGQRIWTHSPRVLESRKMALELLLSDHNADCMSPCSQTCPAEIDIQTQIALISGGRYRDAIGITREKVPFLTTLGRVCPRPCENDCRRGDMDSPIAICSIKRFIGDRDLESYYHTDTEILQLTGKKIAVIGAGPSGLSAAYYLRLLGHEVVIYEQMTAPGGMLRYGIPRYRLPKLALNTEIQMIIDLGIEIKLEHRLGEHIHLPELERDYDAVYLGVGAWGSNKLPVKKSHKIFKGIEFLRRVILDKKITLGKEVIVVGGGNTAVDCARTAARMGAHVSVIYRRTEEEMPANPHEIREAREEGVIFQFLVNPTSLIIEEDNIVGINCVKMALGEPDASGRRRPTPIEHSDFEVRGYTIISAVGQKVENYLSTYLDYNEVEMTRWGTIVADEDTMYTGSSNIFAGGDAVLGPATVVEAVAMGRKAAYSIDKFLLGEEMRQVEPMKMTREKATDNFYESYDDISEIPRHENRVDPGEERVLNWSQYDDGLSPMDLIEECKRCLNCGCYAMDDCKIRTYSDEYGVDISKYQGGDFTDRKIDRSHQYLIFDPSKCIKCGLCVRVCKDLRGVGVFDFAERGFEARISTEFDIPLSETMCISCGDCVDVCPTGSLVGRVPTLDAIPRVEKIIYTTCNNCGYGCNLAINKYGNTIVSVKSDPKWALNGPHLCKMGRFFYDYIYTEDRIELHKVEFQAQLDEVRELLEEQPDDEIAILMNPSLTLEEQFLIRQSADRLGINNVTSTSRVLSGKRNVISIVSEENETYRDILKAEAVILAGMDTSLFHSVLEVDLRIVQKEGTKIFTLGEKSFSCPSDKHYEGEATEILNYLTKKLNEEKKIDQTFVSSITNKEELNKIAEEAKELDLDVSELIEILASDKRVVILSFRENIKAAHNLALATGREGKKNGGLLYLSREANGKGFSAVEKCFNHAEPLEIREGIADGKIKHLITFASNPYAVEELHDWLDNLETLIAFDILPTRTTRHAQYVFPWNGNMEAEGYFINSLGQRSKVNSAIQADFPNWKIITRFGDLRLDGRQLYTMFDQVERSVRKKMKKQLVKTEETAEEKTQEKYQFIYPSRKMQYVDTNSFRTEYLKKGR